LFFTDFAQFFAGWPVWLAAIGVLIMLSLLLAIPLLHRPQAAGFLARTLMNGTTLHSRLLVGFRLIAIVPVLTLLPLLAVISTTTVRDSQLPQVESLADSIAASVPQLVQSRVTGIESLAGHITTAGRIDDVSLREALMRHHASNQEFTSLWVARTTGDVVAATAVKAGRPEPWAGPVAGVAMMDFFKRAVIAGELYVSPVKKGAAADKAPMMFVSAPISLDGDPRWGFVQGLLSLRTVVGGLVSQNTISNVSAVITDQRNRVIHMTPGLALTPFSDLSGHPLMIKAATEEPGKAYSFSGIVNNDGSAARYVAVSRPLANGWRVFATATQASADKTVLVYMALGLIWALLGLMLARGFAPLYGNVVAEPLQKLEESLEEFNAARTITIVPPAPSDAPKEIRQTYARVRKSMQDSRQAYRNMMKVVNDGIELRKELRQVKDTGSHEIAALDQLVTGTPFSDSPDAPTKKMSPASRTWLGQLDSVTELSGLEAFDGFFNEAWTFGITTGRPLAIALARLGETDAQTLKLVAEKMKTAVGRSLDLAARIDEWKFGLILPDTDLNSALAVANKLRLAIEDEIPGPIELCYSAVSIVPNTSGNAKSFLEMCHRALAGAHQKGNGQIVFVNDKGKLTLFSPADAAVVAGSNADDDTTIVAGTNTAVGTDTGDFSNIINWDPGEEASG